MTNFKSVAGQIALDCLDIRDLDEDGTGFYEVEATSLRGALDRAYQEGQEAVTTAMPLPESTLDLGEEQRSIKEKILSGLGVGGWGLGGGMPGAALAQRQWREQCQREQSLDHDWDGDSNMTNVQKMALLTRCFPVLWREGVIQTGIFDDTTWSPVTTAEFLEADLKAEQEGRDYLCRASRQVLKFLLWLWDSSNEFNLRHAWGCWDEHQQAAYRMWMEHPWWP